MFNNSCTDLIFKKKKLAEINRAYIADQTSVISTLIYLQTAESPNGVRRSKVMPVSMRSARHGMQ